MIKWFSSGQGELMEMMCILKGRKTSSSFPSTAMWVWWLEFKPPSWTMRFRDKLCSELGRWKIEGTSPWNCGQASSPLTDYTQLGTCERDIFLPGLIDCYFGFPSLAAELNLNKTSVFLLYQETKSQITQRGLPGPTGSIPGLRLQSHFAPIFLLLPTL